MKKFSEHDSNFYIFLIISGVIAKVVTEVDVGVSVGVSMTETILVILFQLEIIFHPEIASSCPRKHPNPNNYSSEEA